MAGYTPLFSTLTTGTLCGRWPDIGLWPIILSMADKYGIVDCTCAYIAGVTGLPESEVKPCMARFCEPDHGSRSNEYDGARLVLLDDHRDWGWRIVNHGMYREKARKAGQQEQATESGKDAERKRAERAARSSPASSDVQSRPAMSSADRPSDADAYSDSDKDSERVRATKPKKRARDDASENHSQLRAVYPSRAGAQHWGIALKRCETLVADGQATWPELIDAAKRYRAFLEATDGIGTGYVSMASSFYGESEDWREPWTAPEGPKRVRPMTIEEATALEDSRDAAT